MRRDDLSIDLQYGEALTDLALFTSWQRSLAHAAARALVRYPNVQGEVALRTQIARHLSSRRGVVCDAEDIIVVSGAQQAFSLLARVLLDEGESVALEDPGYALAAHCFAAQGARVLPVAVDADGIDTSCLPQERVKLVYVTPSHQFPLGVRLSLPRRQELLAFARRHGAWILEDDYDGEFSADGQRLPALQSLDDTECVVYVGTFSKSVLPSLRLGYIVCPRALRKDILLAKRIADIGSAGIDQLALAHFMATGAYDRHLRRTSVELRKRRKALKDGLIQHCDGRVQLHDSGGGMHIVAWLPGFDADRLQQLIRRAEKRGVGLHELGGHYLVAPKQQALLLGYAGVSVPQIQMATQVLGECMSALTPAG
jgi:GntR family transcriptional regulator/MocR family aminotransferase